MGNKNFKEKTFADCLVPPIIHRCGCQLLEDCAHTYEVCPDYYISWRKSLLIYSHKTEKFASFHSLRVSCRGMLQASSGCMPKLDNYGYWCINLYFKLHAYTFISTLLLIFKINFFLTKVSAHLPHCHSLWVPPHDVSTALAAQEDGTSVQ